MQSYWTAKVNGRTHFEDVSMGGLMKQITSHYELSGSELPYFDTVALVIDADEGYDEFPLPATAVFNEQIAERVNFINGLLS